MHAASGIPNPPSPPGGPGSPGRANTDEDGGVALDEDVEQQRKVHRPRKFQVVFHNDDYTTREFVIEVLIRYFDKDESEATFIMLSVHHKGSGIAGIFPKDVAESKVVQVTKHARTQGFPLRLTAEPE